MARELGVGQIPLPNTLAPRAIETAPSTTSTHVAEHVTQYRETKTAATVRPPKATAIRSPLSTRPQVTFDGSIRTNPLCHLHCPKSHF